ncbi:MAG: hypothetical protein RR061_02140 [Muribaculaceae bacterium]
MGENRTGVPHTMKIVFGIFMICIYVGMGILLFINFFLWTPAWAWARWGLGTLFLIYGVWRGYRQFTGRN